MDEFEAAFFYGDYTALRELTREMLQEEVESTTAQE